MIGGVYDRVGPKGRELVQKQLDYRRALEERYQDETSRLSRMVASRERKIAFVGNTDTSLVWYGSLILSVVIYVQAGLSSVLLIAFLMAVTFIGTNAWKSYKRFDFSTDHKYQVRRIKTKHIFPLEEKLKTYKKLRQEAIEKDDLRFQYLCSQLIGEYPPDWEERRKVVRDRDKHRCVMCGYPKGFQRRVRELHVHHSTPLQEGGDNSLDNLITVCNKCHGELHDRKMPKLTKNKPKSKRRRWRYY